MFQFSRHNWPFIISGCCSPHPCLHYCNQLSCRDPSPCGQLCTHRRFHHRLPPWLRFSVTTTVRMGWTPAPASWCACEIEAHGCPVRFTGDRCSISCDLVSCMHRISFNYMVVVDVGWYIEMICCWIVAVWLWDWWCCLEARTGTSIAAGAIT